MCPDSRRLAAQDTGEGITALSTDGAEAKTHVIVLVNGLFGTAENWTVVVEKLRERLDEASLRTTLIMASMASSRTETYDGIDRCARGTQQESKAPECGVAFLHVPERHSHMHASPTIRYFRNVKRTLTTFTLSLGAASGW